VPYGAARLAEEQLAQVVEMFGEMEHLSNVVRPGTGPVPPTTTLPDSPSACASTTLSMRLNLTVFLSAGSFCPDTATSGHVWGHYLDKNSGVFGRRTTAAGHRT
jgi:hypothetical protein